MSAGQMRPSLPSRRARHMSAPLSGPVTLKTGTSTWGAPPSHQPTTPSPKRSKGSHGLQQRVPQEGFLRDGPDVVAMEAPGGQHKHQGDHRTPSGSQTGRLGPEGRSRGPWGPPSRLCHPWEGEPAGWGGGEGGEEQARTPEGRALQGPREGICRSSKKWGSWRRRGRQREVGLVSRP